jgi:hypothetical protein
LDSLFVRVDELVKDRRPPKAAALRAVLDKFINTNNQHPCDQGRNPISLNPGIATPNDTKSPMLLVSRPQSRRNNPKWQMQ